jgi:hypothetical protein
VSHPALQAFFVEVIDLGILNFFTISTQLANNLFILISYTDWRRTRRFGAQILLLWIGRRFQEQAHENWQLRTAGREKAGLAKPPAE